MSTTINISDHEDEELKFQEFPLDQPDPPRRTSHGHLGDFTDFDNTEEQEELLKEENGAAGGKPKPSFVEFAYYQSFCNVDTSQVMQRIMWSMVPVSGRNSFLNLHIKNNPDLYGPFWISITLILSIAISSNIADYLGSAGRTNHIWHYDFHKVTIAAITIFSYIFLLPLVLFSLLKYNTMRGVRYTLLEILCAYGYSIFIYIPISILWVIQVPVLQWTLVIVGALLSGTVLVKNFWPVLRHTNIKVGALVLVLILTFHTLLAASFVLYFFKPAPSYGEPLPELPPGYLPEVAGSIPKVPPSPSEGNNLPNKKPPPLDQPISGKDEPPGREVVTPNPTIESAKVPSAEPAKEDPKTVEGEPIHAKEDPKHAKEDPKHAKEDPNPAKVDPKQDNIDPKSNEKAPVTNLPKKKPEENSKKSPTLASITHATLESAPPAAKAATPDQPPGTQ